MSSALLTYDSASWQCLTTVLCNQRVTVSKQCKTNSECSLVLYSFWDCTVYSDYSLGLRGSSVTGLANFKESLWRIKATIISASLSRKCQEHRSGMVGPLTMSIINIACKDTCWSLRSQDLALTLLADSHSSAIRLNSAYTVVSQYGTIHSFFWLPYFHFHTLSLQ